MRRIVMFAFSLFIAVCVPALAQDKKEPAKDERTAEEKAIVELTNKERANEKLPPVKINLVLSKVARAHSANMAITGMFEHILDGKAPPDRVKAGGYRFSLCGENISRTEGAFTPAEVVTGWMNSKPHKANILNGNYTEIGVGVVRTAKGEAYYTQVFATPAR
jgi:uncharacterized protein YkwD